MKTTVNLPDNLLAEAMQLTNISNESELMKKALKSLIQKEKVKKIKNFQGMVNLEIDLEVLRNR